MMDNDFYPHLVTAESIQNTSIPTQYTFNLYNNYTYNILTAASSTGNSTLSDDDIIPTCPVAELIDGALQRALVICYQDIDKQEEMNDMNDMDDINDMDEKENIPLTTEIFRRLLEKEPHLVSKYEKYSRQKPKQKSVSTLKVKRKLNNNNNNDNDNDNDKNDDYLTNLRQVLPPNPLKIRELIKTQQILHDDTYSRNISNITTTTYLSHLTQIDEIQQSLSILRKQLNDIRNNERMRLLLRNWKNFKLNWCHWELIDFHEYLKRINGAKYANYISNFKIFSSNWKKIVNLELKNSDETESRFTSPKFNGKKVLIYLDHNDLINFGIISIVHRREILTKLRSLNGFFN